MKDLRDYKENIKSAVAKERDNDPNWSWNVKSINKTIAKIGWGYLDYIGETESFTVEIVDDDECDLHVVVGTIPNGNKQHVFIGENHWDDAKTFQKGIETVIHSMARSAHNTY